VVSFVLIATESTVVFTTGITTISLATGFIIGSTIAIFETCLMSVLTIFFTIGIIIVSFFSGLIIGVLIISLISTSLYLLLSNFFSEAELNSVSFSSNKEVFFKESFLFSFSVKTCVLIFSTSIDELDDVWL
jgi:hypothetical protein